MWALSRVSSDSCTTQEPMAARRLRRSWLTSSTLAPMDDTTVRNDASAWGWSGSTVENVTVRPSLARPRVRMRSSMVTSTLPPDSRAQTFLPSMFTLWYMAAAMPTAPAPSATSFCFSSTVRMALAISPSVTVTTSSTYFRHISKVRSPGVLTLMPSATVSTLERVMISPFFRDSAMLGAPAACTPTTRQSGFRFFTA